jgi:hypothetical protein
MITVKDINYFQIKAPTDTCLGCALLDKEGECDLAKEPNHNDYPMCGDKIWKLHHIQYVKVRQDILDDLYAAIEEVADQAGRGEDIRFGNVLQLADELKANKRYSERKVIK